MERQCSPTPEFADVRLERLACQQMGRDCARVDRIYDNQPVPLVGGLGKPESSITDNRGDLRLARVQVAESGESDLQARAVRLVEVHLLPSASVARLVTRSQANDGDAPAPIAVCR